MALIVQKFGGTSVGSTERIKNVAKRIARWKAQGHDIVVVPSAMSGETNRLLGLAKDVSPAVQTPSVTRELDMIACNDVSRADIGFASDENAMIVFFAEQYQMQKRDLDKAPKQEIAQQLVEAIHDALHHEMAPV